MKDNDNVEVIGEEKREAKQEDKLTGIDSITDNLIDSMPGVSEHVINTHDTPGLTVNSGDTRIVNPVTSVPDPAIFDPNVHAQDKNGDPIKNKDGTFRKKPGVKKGGAGSPKLTNNSTLASDNQNNSMPLNPRDEQARNDALLIGKFGSVACSQIRSVCGGEQANDDERAYLEAALETWANETGAAMSPNTGLVLALSVFFFPVVLAPRPKNIFFKTYSKVKSIIKWKFGSVVPNGEKKEHLKEVE